MQEAAPQGQGQGQRKLSPIVAGIGAAAIAAAVTVVIMLSHPAPVATSDQAASTTRQCQLIPRKILVSTTVGSGTVRFRASGYLSPPFTLTTQPQPVVFPLPRPDTTPVEEVISVEGNATDVVITSDVTDLRKVFDVVGSYTYTVKWAPMKSC